MRSYCCLLLFFWAVPTVVADQVVWEKTLREAVKYPSIRLTIGVGADCNGKLSFSDETVATQRKEPDVELLLKQYDKSPAEFLKLEAIVDALSYQNLTERTKEYVHQGVLDGPVYLKDHPDDIRGMLLLGRLLEREGQNEEAERWLKRATQVMPKNPKTWRVLGLHYLNRSIQIVAKDPTFGLDDPMELVVKVSPSHRQEFRDYLLWAQVNGKPEAAQFLAKASDCFDWGVMLSPKKPESHVFRCNWHQTLFMLLMDEKTPQNQHYLRTIFSNQRILLELKTKEDAHETARLSTDPRAVAAAIFAELTQFPDRKPETDEDRLKEIQGRFREHQIRLVQMQQSTDPVISTNATRTIILLKSMVFHEFAEAERLLRSLKPDPNDSFQDQLAMLVYGFLDQRDGMETLMRQKLAMKPNPVHYFMLAKSLIHSKKYDSAKTILDEALKKYPKDLQVNSLFASLLIAEGSQDDLTKAEKLLTTIDTHFASILNEYAKTVTWDEKNPQNPPEELRGEVCVDMLSATDQELLLNARNNRLILMGLNGQSRDTFPLLRKWLAFQRREYGVLLTTHSLLDKDRIQRPSEILPAANSVLPVLAPEGNSLIPQGQTPLPVLEGLTRPSLLSPLPPR